MGRKAAWSQQQGLGTASTQCAERHAVSGRCGPACGAAGADRAAAICCELENSAAVTSSVSSSAARGASDRFRFLPATGQPARDMHASVYNWHALRMRSSPVQV